jgi:hypothetical protein
MKRRLAGCFFSTLILGFCFCRTAPAFLEGPGVEECGAEQFASAVKILISIQDESGNEVWNGFASGAVVKDNVVMTARHAFANQLEIDAHVPKAIAEKYSNKKLVAKYYVDGKPAKYALETGKDAGFLIFDQPLNHPPARLNFSTKFDKGRVCQVAGYSPIAEAGSEKKFSKEYGSEKFQNDLVALEEIRKNRRTLFGKIKKRCGQLVSSGTRPVSRRVGTVPDSSPSLHPWVLFDGLDQGQPQVQSGDSGAACFVKVGDEWQVAGTVEATYSQAGHLYSAIATFTRKDTEAALDAALALASNRENAMRMHRLRDDKEGHFALEHR